MSLTQSPANCQDIPSALPPHLAAGLQDIQPWGPSFGIRWLWHCIYLFLSNFGQNTDIWPEHSTGKSSVQTSNYKTYNHHLDYQKAVPMMCNVCNDFTIANKYFQHSFILICHPSLMWLVLFLKSCPPFAFTGENLIFILFLLLYPQSIFQHGPDPTSHPPAQWGCHWLRSGYCKHPQHQLIVLIFHIIYKA